MPSIASQLAPLVGKLREGRAAIRPISQITVRLKPTSGKARFDQTVDDVLRWMNNRAGRKLPDQAWQRHSFELSDIGAQRVAAVALADPRYWTGRLDDADKTVPLRTWITEVGIGLEENQDTILGVRLICATRGEDIPFNRTIPGFVRPILMSSIAELDGHRLQSVPRQVSSRQEVLDLVDLLESPTRQADVVVFSLAETAHALEGWDRTIQRVHMSLLGASHVVVLTPSAASVLTGILGKQMSVFNGGVRSYRPGFNASTSEPPAHPLAVARRIANWNNGGGPSEFENWLVNQALGNTIYGFDREQRVPSFETIRQLSAREERDKLRKAGATDTELMKLFEEDNEKLRREIEELKTQYDGLLDMAEAEKQSALAEADAARSLAIERLQALRAAQARTPAAHQAPIELPSSLDVFEVWCKANLAGSVEIANKAYTAVRKSNFAEPGLIYGALQLLKDFYVPMRTEGSPERKRQYDEALVKLGLEESSTGDGVKYAPDIYSVVHDGRRRPLDRHLKGSNARDRRFGFRLYFFWDDEMQVVVVGWLPSHLDNRMT